jgi:hypothetical protein
MRAHCAFRLLASMEMALFSIFSTAPLNTALDAAPTSAVSSPFPHFLVRVHLLAPLVAPVNAKSRSTSPAAVVTALVVLNFSGGWAC